MNNEVKLYDLERESSLLGALLVNNKSFDFIAGKIRAEHFFEPIHQAIFGEIERRVGQGEPATPLSVRGCLPAGMTIPSGQQQITGLQYLARMAVGATAAVNVPYWGDALVQFAAAREHGINNRSFMDRLERGIQIDEALKIYHEQTEAIRMGYLGLGMRDTSSSIADTMHCTVERVTAAVNGTVTSLGAMTGIVEFDKMTGGLQRGDLVVMAGRPGMGKSTVAVSMARQLAANGYGVGFMSLEMGKEQIGSHFITDHIYERFPIAYTRIMRGNISTKAQDEIGRGASELRDLPLEFDFSTRLTVSALGAKARRMAGALERKHKKPLRVLFVDYLKFVQATDRYAGQRVQEVGEITSALKELARLLDCCIVLLHQLNRENEKKADKRPSLENLRESGDVEQDADVVILLFRESYYLVRDGSKDPDIKERLDQCEYKMTLILAKQRMGPAGDVGVFCDIASSAIRSPPPKVMPLPSDMRNDDPSLPPLPADIQEFR